MLVKINDLREYGADTAEHTRSTPKIKNARRSPIRPRKFDHEAKKPQLTACELGFFQGAPPGTRTPDPLIKSQLPDVLNRAGRRHPQAGHGFLRTTPRAARRVGAGRSWPPDGRFDVPTTIAPFRDRLYLPNARFTTTPTPTTTYNVVAISVTDRSFMIGHC
ncbi:hypothetical protein Acor_17310 [Acrocarpospora corrugata]|uniref:Uncharacterized protein n=1 Tax=Acrocarpospora corrugata TaxID=35763 RepID=A0A5M3VZ64_9ACTN|nr:hypothetical protein [Acrocarpospora corrugata]GER99667.1 hypothetical protein Acor_17310 [Acrocarpospora corrugata]